MLGTAVLFTGCAEQTESEPLSTIPTEPVVYEDTGKSVIHAGYYGENKKVYINKATSIAGAEKTNPDYEIETSYDYDGRKTEICVYTYNGEEKTLLKQRAAVFLLCVVLSLIEVKNIRVMNYFTVGTRFLSP